MALNGGKKDWTLIINIWRLRTGLQWSPGRTPAFPWRFWAQRWCFVLTEDSWAEAVHLRSTEPLCFSFADLGSVGHSNWLHTLQLNHTLPSLLLPPHPQLAASAGEMGQVAAAWLEQGQFSVWRYFQAQHTAWLLTKHFSVAQELNHGHFCKGRSKNVSSF